MVKYDVLKSEDFGEKWSGRITSREGFLSTIYYLEVMNLNNGSIKRRKIGSSHIGYDLNRFEFTYNGLEANSTLYKDLGKKISLNQVIKISEFPN